MGEDEVNRILRKVIEGRALRDNVTEKGMVLFNKGLLGSAHGITVKQGDFPFPILVIFKGEGIREFPAVVTQEGVHDCRDGEAGVPKAVFKGAEVFCPLGGGFVIEEDAGHEVAGCKMDSHDDLAGDTPNHSVELDMSFEAMEGAVVQEVIVGTAEADAGGDVVRLPYPAGLEFDGPWKVNTGGGIIAFLEMAVDSALGAGDLRGIGHDMIEVLSPAEGIGDDAVGLVEILFIKRDALPGIREECPVF